MNLLSHTLMGQKKRRGGKRRTRHDVHVLTLPLMHYVLPILLLPITLPRNEEDEEKKKPCSRSGSRLSLRSLIHRFLRWRGQQQPASKIISCTSISPTPTQVLARSRSITRNMTRDMSTKFALFTGINCLSLPPHPPPPLHHEQGIAAREITCNFFLNLSACV